MSWFRAYLNKTKGNEHSRVIDVEADDMDAAGDAVTLEVKRDETLEQIVQLTGPPEAP